MDLKPPTQRSVVKLVDTFIRFFNFKNIVVLLSLLSYFVLNENDQQWEFFLPTTSRIDTHEINFIGPARALLEFECLDGRVCTDPAYGMQYHIWQITTDFCL